jgi:hypothetical protein
VVWNGVVHPGAHVDQGADTKQDCKARR